MEHDLKSESKESPWGGKNWPANRRLAPFLNPPFRISLEFELESIERDKNYLY